jgi:hypothetical protein
MCFVDELNVVRNHLQSLDDPDLRSAYYKDRKSIIDEVRMVCHDSLKIVMFLDKMTPACDIV